MGSPLMEAPSPTRSRTPRAPATTSPFRVSHCPALLYGSTVRPYCTALLYGLTVRLVG